MRRGLFVYNPNSGDRSIPKKLDSILERCQQNEILLQPYRLTDGINGRILEGLLKSQIDFVVVSGGDGTVNSVVNMLIKNDIHIPLGLIPAGTCNDFARCLDIPTDFEKCIDIIIQGKTMAVDVGLANDETYFLSTLAGGLFVGVSFSTHSELKMNFGPFAYYLNALNELANIRTFDLKITANGEIHEMKCLLFLVLNGKHAAGFSNLVQHADFADGMMDIMVIKECRPMDLASLLFKVLSNEELENKNILTIQTSECLIEGDSDVVSSIDGEKGPVLPVKVKFLQKALDVFVKL